jgi:hypothetical protein
MNRVFPGLFCCLIIQCGVASLHASTPPNLKLAGALDAAHSLYVQPDTMDGVIAAYITSYVQAWGRYTNSSTPHGADLIFRYNYDFGGFSNYLVLNVYDGKTLEKLATVNQKIPLLQTENAWKKVMSGSLDQLVSLAGPNRPKPSKTMARPLPPPYQVDKDTQRAKFTDSTLYTFSDTTPPLTQPAQNILVVDGLFEMRVPYKSSAAYRLLVADIEASGRFKVVTSIDQADLVFDIGAIPRFDTSGYGPNDNRYTPLGPEIDIAVMAASTMRELWVIRRNCEVPQTLGILVHPGSLSAPSTKADQLPATIQAMVNTFGQQMPAQP